MRLTAELALDQVRRNRKRTMGTVGATALSTALLTAIMCFVTSGYRMLENFLGPGLGEYAGTYVMILLIPSLFLGMLIIFMSVTVISNIYESSAGKRLGEFGVLKSVGATGRQIRETVICESLWISLAAIPLGLISGTVIGFIGVLTAGRFVSYFNDLSKSIVMRPISFSLKFHVSCVTYIAAAAFSMMVVFISAAKPAARSGRITALQCVRGHLDDPVNVSGAKDDPFIEKFLGYEGSLARKNIIRNKKAYRSSVRALALSIALILLAGSFGKQARGAMQWMTGMGNDMLVDYTSVMNDVINDRTGKPETRIVAPISCETAEEITGKLRAYQPGFEVTGVGSDRETFKTVPDNEVMTDEFLSAREVINEYGEIKTELLTADDKTYTEICRKAQVPAGSTILINSYAYNDNGEMKTVTPMIGTVSEITLIDSVDETRVIPIDAMLTEDDLDSNAFGGISQPPVRLIVPGGDSRYFTWYSDPDDDVEFAQYARGIMDEYFPVLTEDSYAEQGFSVRISRAGQMIRVMNIAVILGEILLTGLIILLVIMGFAGVISTLSTNLKMRRREFAVLKSVGMTRASLEKMIFSESILCSARAAVLGLTGGILLPWLINLSVRKVFPVKYELPVAALLTGILTVSVLVLLIAGSEIRKLRGQNIIEDIRMDLM